MKMLTILGPTASGKTSLAVAVAARAGAEIVSADSRQVYRRMDIGTGKDLGDYQTGGGRVPCHLIDIAEPGAKYNLFQYQHDFLKVYRELQARGVTPILCGGTGLYIEAVLRGYRLAAVPENKPLRAALAGKPLGELTAMLARLKAANGSVMHNTTDVDTAQRAIRAIEIETFNGEHPAEAAALPPIPSVVVGVSIGRDERRRNISQRLRQRLDSGMVDEVGALLGSGIAAEDLMYYGLEYRYVTEYVIGRRSYGDMVASLETAIHQFAKRQMTWFRGMERRGIPIHWVDSSLPAEEKAGEVMRIWEESDRAQPPRASI